jgi:hypothetical protein
MKDDSLFPFGLILGLILSLFAWIHPSLAVEQCKLSNPVYRNLQDAATALVRKVSIECKDHKNGKELEEFGKKITEASQQLAEINKENAATQSKKDQTPPADPQKAAEDKAKQDAAAQEAQKNVEMMVGGIVGVTDVLQRYSGGSCGKKLLTRSDFAEAMIDTVNGLTPYLLFFGKGSGNAAPIILAANLLGSAVKLYLGSKKNAYDMSKDDQFQTFIENACGFYELHENVRPLTMGYDQEKTEVKDQIKSLEQEIKDLIAKAPAVPKPVERYIKMDAEFMKDRKQAQALAKLFQRQQENDLFLCRTIRTRIAKKEGFLPAVARLRELLLESERMPDYQPTTAKDLINGYQQISMMSYFPTEPQKLKECAEHARGWLKVVNEILDATEAELNTPGRLNLTQTPEFEERKKWEELMATKQKALDHLEQRLDDLDQYKNQGEWVEKSRLFSKVNTIRRNLFGDAKKKSFFGGSQVSPAKAWLDYLWREAGLSLNEFKQLVPRLKREWLSRPGTEIPDKIVRKNACSAMAAAYMSYSTAEAHSRATLDFCDLFVTSQVINEATFPDVSRFCFGTHDSKGEKINQGQIEKRVEEVNQEAGLKNQIFDWMKQAGCARPRPITY